MYIGIASACIGAMASIGVLVEASPASRRGAASGAALVSPSLGGEASPDSGAVASEDIVEELPASGGEDVGVPASSRGEASAPDSEVPFVPEHAVRIEARARWAAPACERIRPGG